MLREKCIMCITNVVEFVAAFVSAAEEKVYLVLQQPLHPAFIKWYQQRHWGEQPKHRSACIQVSCVLAGGITKDGRKNAKRQKDMHTKLVPQQQEAKRLNASCRVPIIVGDMQIKRCSRPCLPRSEPYCLREHRPSVGSGWEWPWRCPGSYSWSR